MGVELLKIGVKVRKGVIFTIRGCFRSVCNHPFLVGVLCFLIFLYRLSPFIFQLLVSASPILVCTAVLLGTLLSFGQPNIPEIEVEEKTTFEAVSIKTGVSGETAVVEKNESYYVDRFSQRRWDETEQSTEQPDLSVGKLDDVRREDSDDTAPLIEKRSPRTEVNDGEIWEGSREFGDLGYKLKTDWIEERLNNGEVMENHYALAAKANDELLESDDEKSEADSFDSEKVNVDSLDSPPHSPWTRVKEREGEEEEDEEEEGASDSGSERAESSSPDASMADIMPMLDELHPLLDAEAPQTVHRSRGGSDAASEKSPRSGTSSRESDDESENHEDLEVADDDNEDGEDEEDGQGDKEEETKSVITWTEEDQKNLMDLGSSEIERNQRLENLILRRRARKMVADRNLIDLESSDLPLHIAPISTRRTNPFDLAHDYYDNSGLPPIPGSAPSVLLPRRNPFDIPYDSSEEKPDLMGDGFLEEFKTSQSREPFFRRHESFNVGPSNFAPKRQVVKMRPYFVPEGSISEASISSLFQRQSSELSESKLSSVPDTESISSVTSVEDPEDRKLSEEDNLPEVEVIERTKEVTGEGPSGDSELISQLVVDTEEDVHREPETISKMECVFEHVGHGNQSSEEEYSLELGQVENRDVEVGELESQMEDIADHYERGSVIQDVEVQGTGYHSNYEAVEQTHTRDSSSSSLSEVSDRVFTETEGERLTMLFERRDGVAEEPHIFTQTSVESTDLNITSMPVNDIPHREPVYDTSPRELGKIISSSSISSNVHPESDLGSLPVIDKRTVSSIERESEGSSQEVEKEIPNNVEMLPDSSVAHPVDESRPMDVVDIREDVNINIDFSGVDQRSISEGSPAAAGIAPHEAILLKSSDEASVEEHLMEQHRWDEIPVSSADKNIDTLVKSSEDSQEDNYMLLSRDRMLEDNEPPFEDQLRAEHSVGMEETVQSPNSDADVNHEADAKLISTPSAEGNTSLFHERAIYEPNSRNLNEMQASSTPVESFVDDRVTQKLNVPEVHEIDHYISSNVNSPSSPEFVTIPPSAVETTTSHVDVQTIVEEVDEIKEIDDALLSELDNVGDFSIKQLGSGSSEFKKHIDSVGEESLSSPHRAESRTVRDVDVHSVEVNKIEDALHSENSREHIGIYEEDVECISELQTSETRRAEDIEASIMEFNENDGQDSPYRETSGEETLSRETEVQPGPELEVRSIEDVDAVPLEKAELTSVGMEIIGGGAEVSGQGQVDTDTTSRMPELEASTIEDIDLAFKQIISSEIEKPVVLEPAQAELHNREETVPEISESEVQSSEDVDAVPRKAELTSVETETMVGGGEVSPQGQVDTGTPSGMPELEASTIEGIDLAFKQISSKEIEKPVVLEPHQAELHDVEDTVCGIPELEASTVEDIDLAFKRISAKEIEKPVTLEPPQAELHNYEDFVPEKPEFEEQSIEDADTLSKKAEFTLVESEIMVGSAEASCQNQVGTDTTSGITELEARTIEDIDMAFQQITSKEIEKSVDLEPAQAELVVGETATEKFEDHRDSNVTISTHETSVREVGMIEDATLDDKHSTESITGSHGLHDSVDRTLHVVESGETQSTSSELHVTESIPSEDTTLPPNQVLDGETLKQLKLNSDDGSVEVKADKVGPSEEESSVKESSAFAAEKSEHEAEAPEDLHSPSSVKGKGKISESSSSSSSSSSESSSSDSDQE